jgi:tRNA(fMet)-specific endonuclease VapC
VNKSLLDTDILSEVERGRNRIVLFREREYRAEWGLLSISAVTVMEIVHGHWWSGNARLLSRFIAAVGNQQVLPFTATTAELAGKIGAELDKRGASIGLNDPMIAATAIEHGLVLVTGNTKHYERIQQIGFPLRIANWRESDS